MKHDDTIDALVFGPTKRKARMKQKIKIPFLFRPIAGVLVGALLLFVVLALFVLAALIGVLAITAPVWFLAVPHLDVEYK